jgi:hypothetical protein
MWKACHNILLTKENLFKRRVVDNKLCPCCEREEETTLHALWGCPSARDVRQAIKLFQEVSHCGGELCHAV